MTTPPHLVRGLGWILLSVLCWVPLFPLAKRVLPIVDAFALGSVRYAIGGVLFVALLAAIEGRQALRYEGRFLPAAIFGPNLSLIEAFTASMEIRRVRAANPPSSAAFGTGRPT